MAFFFFYFKTITNTLNTFFLLPFPPKVAQYQKCMRMSDCEMLKTNSYIDIKCCSGDLCNTFDESAWWPYGNAVHSSPVVAHNCNKWRSTCNECKPALWNTGQIKRMRKDHLVSCCFVTILTWIHNVCKYIYEWFGHICWILRRQPTPIKWVALLTDACEPDSK